MDYSYGYDSYDSTLLGIFGGFTFLFVILGIILLAAAIVGIIACWKLYVKAGKKGWESIVPFYSYWVLIEIAGLNWWWFLLIIATNIVSLLGIDGLSSIASLVSTFASFNCYYNIAKKFNKTTGTAVCAGIFSFIFIMIFGFSKNEVYDLNAPVSKNGVFGPAEAPTNTNNYQNNVQPQQNVNNMNTVVPPVNNQPQVQQPQDVNVETTNTTQDAQPVDNNTSDVGEVSFCGNCGTKLANGVSFCPNCGTAK